MKFIFNILSTFNVILICVCIGSCIGATIIPDGTAAVVAQAAQQVRKCKYYSSDIADEDSDPECGKDSTFCFSLWRISPTTSSSPSISNNNNSHDQIESSNHSHGRNNNNNSDIVKNLEDADGSSINNNYIKNNNSTAAATSNFYSADRIEFIKQGCWEASPKSSCDNKNCTSIIRINPITGVATLAPNQQFFCCCNGDFCNQFVYVVEKGEDDDDDYLDALNERAELGRDHDHDYNQAHSQNRWMVVGLIVIAILFGTCFTSAILFYWRKGFGGSGKNRDEEMIEVEEKLIGNGGIGFGGVIVRSGNDDGKNWQLSKDETFVLGNEIAKGKYATVFNGKVGGSNVALKIFASEHKEVYKNERWILECLSKFKSERIIKYHGWQELSGASGPEMIIVLDRIYPGSLRDYLCSENLNLTLDQCLKITCGIVEGISVLHGCNPDGIVIAHRDLTTKNILIDTELNTYIADFGLSLKTHGSKYTHGGNFVGCIEKQAETSNLCEAGTLRYMSPELLEGAVNLKDCESSLKQIDIYSIAIIIWEVINLCGDVVLNVGHKLPFHELGKEITMESLSRAVVLRRQRPTFTNWRDHAISRQFRETIVDSWDPEPEARLTSLCILERLHDLSLINSKNSSLLATLKTIEEPLESNCYNDEDFWINRNPNNERNIYCGKNGDDSASSTQYLVTRSDKHLTPSNNSSSTPNNPNNSVVNNNMISHNNQHNVNHNHSNLGRHHPHHHHPEQSISTDGGESMTTMNTELSSASLTNFVQNVL